MPPHNLGRDGPLVLWKSFLASWQRFSREAAHLLQGVLPKLGKVGVWGRQPRKRITLKVVLVITSILLLLGLWHYFVAPNAWAVILAGERIGIVTSQEEARKALEKVRSALESAGYQGIEIAAQVEYVPVRVDRERINTEEELERILAQKVAFRVLATEIRIDDKPITLVKDDKTAQKVLEEIKKAYTPGEGQIEEVKFKERVTLNQRLAAPEEVLPFEQAVAKLLGGAETKDYTVQEGDSLWSIAQRYGLTVEQLRADNPQVQGERLDIGQVLKIRAASPLVHVVVTYRHEN